MFFFTKFFLKLLRMNNGLTYGLAVFFIVASAFVAYWLEPETFQTPFNGLWWVMTTVTTVGYGDFYPKTTAGKCFGIFLYLFGIGLISITISKVIDALFLYQRKKEEGKLRYTGENHLVMIDWSKHAELAIREILDTDPDAEVVLIDTHDKTPFPHSRVHYVQGNPVDAAVLERANLGRARAVFIFANDVTEHHMFIRDSSFIDGKTLLIATAIERHYGSVHTIAEVKDQANLPSFKQASVNEFILSSDTVAQMAVRAAYSPGVTNVLAQLMTRRYGDDLYEIGKRPHWATYRDAFTQLLQEGATLISDGDDLNINRKLDDPIPEKARLFVICTKETYRKLQ